MRSETAFEKSVREAGAGRERATSPARRTRQRQWVVGAVFLTAMAAAALRLADFAASADGVGARAPVVETADQTATPRRRVITDRNGLSLAGGVKLYDIAFDSELLSFPAEGVEVARDLSALFPEVDATAMSKRFAGGGDHPIKWGATPREAQEAFELGWPGLHMSERIARVYFSDRLAAHVLGAVNRAGDGYSGVEGALDATLKTGGEPLALSIDLRMQGALRETLLDAMFETGAKSAAGLVLSPETGEVLAMVSLPDYDPHRPPRAPADPKLQARSPLFNHAVQGVYELGSVLKLATWALALETGVARMTDVYEPPQPFELDGYTIGDDHPINDALSFPMALARSSNIVAAKLALEAGPKAQHRLFEALGLHEATPLELLEAPGAKPGWPAPWGRLTTATAAYGHGVAVSLSHVAAAVASLVNGGEKVSPTLLKLDRAPADRPMAVSPETSKRMREMMRLVVTSGTGRSADAPGLEVGGKTGTADKPDPNNGGYLEDKVIASFVAAFPMSAPKAVVAVMLDEPEVTVNGEKRRSASYTAAPAARKVIERIAPFLGVIPKPAEAG